VNLNEQEQHEADATASLAMSDLIRGAVGQRRVTGSTPTASTSPLAVALHELDAARASGDGGRVAAASAAVDRVVEGARDADTEARRAAVPDFKGGARYVEPSTTPEATFTAQMRRDSGRPA
jgi:hypothetical protein